MIRVQVDLDLGTRPILIKDGQGETIKAIDPVADAEAKVEQALSNVFGPAKVKQVKASKGRR